jgi:hypothetical protein
VPKIRNIIIIFLQEEMKTVIKQYEKEIPCNNDIIACLNFPIV